MRTTPRQLPLLLIVVGLACAIVALVGSPAGAASVVPIPTGSAANIPCSTLDNTFGGGQTWTEIKFDPPQDGSQGGVTVDVTGNTFNWTSTVGVDAVYVKGSGPASQIYVYAPTPNSPESFGDTNLTTANGQAISHISFCIDTANPTTTTTVGATTTSTTIAATTTSTTVAATTTSTTVGATTTSTTTPVTSTSTTLGGGTGGTTEGLTTGPGIPGDPGDPAPEPTVLGTVVTRELPRTGSGTNVALLGLGLGFVLLGFAFQAQQRRLAVPVAPAWNPPERPAPWNPPDFPG